LRKGATMLSQTKLLKSIDDDLQRCREALNPTDEPGTERRRIELSTLLNQLLWTNKVGDNQAELERIVDSLERNPFLGDHQPWREKPRYSRQQFNSRRRQAG
jgi:hypothetical protein